MRKLIAILVMCSMFAFNNVEASDLENWSYYLGKDELTGLPEPSREIVGRTTSVLDSFGQLQYISMAYYCGYNAVSLLAGPRNYGRAFKRNAVMRFKFDNSPIITVRPKLRDDRYSEYNRQADIINTSVDWGTKFKQHHKVLVEFTPSYGLPVVAEFSLLGFTKEYLKCEGWKYK